MQNTDCWCAAPHLDVHHRLHCCHHSRLHTGQSAWTGASRTVKQAAGTATAAAAAAAGEHTGEEAAAAGALAGNATAAAAAGDAGGGEGVVVGEAPSRLAESADEQAGVVVGFLRSEMDLVRREGHHVGRRRARDRLAFADHAAATAAAAQRSMHQVESAAEERWEEGGHWR